MMMMMIIMKSHQLSLEILTNLILIGSNDSLIVQSSC